MTTDDTSRDVLIERVARALDAEGAFCGECDSEPGGFYDECSQCRRFLTGYATAVVDAVVMPLVEERDAARAEALRVDEANTRMGRELTAARAELAAAEADRDTYRDRWRQLMRDYEAEFNRAEFNRAENERLRILWDASGKNDLIERAEVAEAAHKALTEAVQAALDGDSLVVCDVGVAAVPDDTLRAILTEHGAARIEKGEQG